MPIQTNADMRNGNGNGDKRSRGGRARAVIERVTPCVDCGRFPIKRVVGEAVRVEADVFADGHDRVACAILYRTSGAERWSQTPMTFTKLDRWVGEFTVGEEGRWEYNVEAWVDHFETWTYELQKRQAAGQDLAMEYLVGAQLVEEAAAKAGGQVSDQLASVAAALRNEKLGAQRYGVAVSDSLAALMRAHAPRPHATRLAQPLQITVDRVRARFSSWYELFPRSTSGTPGRHGTFRDVEQRLPYVASMGFDVLYLPPIHPIGRAFRKAPNNKLNAGPNDPGSPWAIGGVEGGHTSVHPQLGTLDDFDALVKAAKRYDIDVALDIAFQCSPDHPYVRDHPQWFKKRPDGTIQYAENPPKKYQDIYPFDFESEDWESLWNELRDVVLFWADRGVRVFRVDNPHTKAFPFWEWMIGQVKEKYPDALFLSEAFTRRSVMYRLAKLGFTQSYTYFAWRNHPREIEKYYTELTQTDVVEYFRPNAWPNTPDILPEFLQDGGPNVFVIRAILAATLCANWGVYGPAFELMEHTPREPGSEEYLDSEKYQIRQWDLNRPDSLRPLLTKLNAIRRANPALQQDRTLRFHDSDNAAVLCFSKTSADQAVIVVVNTDPYQSHNSTITLDYEALGLEEDQGFEVQDLLSNDRWIWHRPRNLVILNNDRSPAHVLVMKRKFRTEQDFDYFY
jgi:starch synthase (maltosyl-transferring)